MCIRDRSKSTGTDHPLVWTGDEMYGPTQPSPGEVCHLIELPVLFYGQGEWGMGLFVVFLRIVGEGSGAIRAFLRIVGERGVGISPCFPMDCGRAGCFQLWLSWTWREGCVCCPWFSAESGACSKCELSCSVGDSHDGMCGKETRTVITCAGTRR
eukprot:1160968-Rhodomonas_salina.1